MFLKFEKEQPMQSQAQSQNPNPHRARPKRPVVYNYDTNSFWMRWLGSSLFVWLMSIVVTLILFVPVAFFFGAFGLTLINSSVQDTLISGMMMVLAGGAIGFSVGVLQRYVLTNVLYWTADYWRLSSTIGGVIGAIVLGVLTLITDQYLLEDMLFTLAAMPIFATILGLTQMIALRVAVRQSWLWVLANLVGCDGIFPVSPFGYGMRCQEDVHFRGGKFLQADVALHVAQYASQFEECRNPVHTYIKPIIRLKTMHHANSVPGGHQNCHVDNFDGLDNFSNRGQLREWWRSRYFKKLAPAVLARPGYFFQVPTCRIGKGRLMTREPCFEPGQGPLIIRDRSVLTERDSVWLRPGVAG